MPVVLHVITHRKFYVMTYVS
ncbi:hypothetical protein F383_36282 [Gossypium arboreum]|uniref:Uncharacterized protein n=1 Tax=Gossypium arboreum TaxID=29729 RepID=A0A0B0N873_GOSAR|nr:hypothetical protein F383_36282 [Gossypium arboreum]